MGREQLQGTPWHEEQMHRTCKDGSTNCIFNSKGKCAFVSCRFYDEPCKGNVYCKIKLPKVAKQNWTKLQVQIGHNCKAKYTGSQERCSA